MTSKSTLSFFLAGEKQNKKDKEVKETKESGSSFLFDKMSFCMVGKRHVKIFIRKIYSVCPSFLFCRTLSHLLREEMATLDVWESREGGEVNGNTNTLTAEYVPFTPARVSVGL